MKLAIQTTPDTLTIQDNARPLLAPKHVKHATGIVFGQSYRRVYQDRLGLWCKLNGKRVPVYVLQA
jgi:hypothetical protein